MLKIMFSSLNFITVNIVYQFMDGWKGARAPERNFGKHNQIIYFEYMIIFDI